MKKRTFLKAVLASGGIVLTTRHQLQNPAPALSSSTSPLPITEEGLGNIASISNVPELVETTAQEELVLQVQQESELHPSYVHQEHHQRAEIRVEMLPDEKVDEYLQKIRNFDADFRTDIFLDEASSLLLLPTVNRLERVQNFVGHANFNLLSFQEMLYFARNYSEIGKFTPQEIEFLEQVFQADAKRYGFFGEKVTPDINHRILQKDVAKIDGSGHFLRRGESLNHYNQIKKDVGNQLQLTSGIRNNVKQMHLFLAKALQSNGNLSKASRSLAPPGHSFHNAGDFDVGKLGLGELNFTSDFSHTEEFQRMVRLGYVDIRYTDTNQYGVRFEPWHIKLG